MDSIDFDKIFIEHEGRIFDGLEPNRGLVDKVEKLHEAESEYISSVWVAGIRAGFEYGYKLALEDAAKKKPTRRRRSTATAMSQ